jgi:hypothetical protein
MADEKPSPAEVAEISRAQMRRSDPLNDADVRDRVKYNDELTAPERFLRRMAAQKKPIGGFLIGLGTLLSTAAAMYPKQWLSALSALCGTAGGLLVGGGSARLRSDEYDKVKNELLKQRGLM